ncbi:hypothetical protein CEXT_76091 [Caerostris extrusa]|uniref:Uncharacterized protein n=1 Tax=Caerostris extrusa TaxID=172846 RepID=A0AAV4W9T7_CAEEX|nr:hypothetical protein CEXT_76091 [Caerostris extrusa]
MPPSPPHDHIESLPCIFYPFMPPQHFKDAIYFRPNPGSRAAWGRKRCLRSYWFGVEEPLLEEQGRDNQTRLSEPLCQVSPKIWSTNLKSGFRPIAYNPAYELVIVTPLYISVLKYLELVISMVNSVEPQSQWCPYLARVVS